MARRKADFESVIIIQEFLTKPQAMAYTNRLTEEKFNEDIEPYVNIYHGGKGGCYFLPELRERMLNLLAIRKRR